MDFELVDRYLLDGSPSKPEVVKHLLAHPSEVPEAKPFYEGMKILGARTPDLSLMALRLVLAGKKADDQSVVALRALVERVRAGDPGGDARTAYQQSVGANGE
jgi:hypothetical protein